MHNNVYENVHEIVSISMFCFLITLYCRFHTGRADLHISMCSTSSTIKFYQSESLSILCSFYYSVMLTGRSPVCFWVLGPITWNIFKHECTAGTHWNFIKTLKGPTVKKIALNNTVIEPHCLTHCGLVMLVAYRLCVIYVREDNDFNV